MSSGTQYEPGVGDPLEERANCGVGAVVNLDGGRDEAVVGDALDLLANLEHRGTTGAEANTGDGAGVVLQIPHEFFADVFETTLPDPYAVGSVFLPTDAAVRDAVVDVVENTFEERGLDVLEWRRVPTGDADLGKTARESEPEVWQVAVTADGDASEAAFDRTCYEARRLVEKRVEEAVEGASRFYVCSLDRQTVVYKGLLTAEQLPQYYPDLRDDRLRSTFAVVHARFSTNTLGAWHLAHPYHNLVHNGEFNTIQGNRNWMRARESDLAHDDLDLDAVTPVISRPDGSDSSSVDDALGLLMQTGRDLPEALRFLVPEAWRQSESISADRRDWYDFHASLVEPWDGPALVVANDGERIAAVLDRNGLRPCRYDVTTDDRLILASEVGALDTDAAEVKTRGRLEPGQVFVADPEAGRVVPDDEVFANLTDPKYGEWLDEQLRLCDLPATQWTPAPADELRARQATFGYTHDELNHLLEPMMEDGKDPVGSMGDDTPLSVLADHDRGLFSYFKQQFAQVTNPPIDYIREELVTSLETRLGHQRNLLSESPAHARQVVCDSPILTDDELAAIQDLDGDVSAATVDVTYDPDQTTLREAVERVRADATAAVEAGHDVVVLSDRPVGPGRAPVPSLLATGAVHHHLVRAGLRARVGLVVESGDPRTVHHHAALVGYGAGAVNPYLAFETIADLTAGPDGAEPDDAVDAYVGALEQGVLKTMAKMGISTVESYQGAQVFEAVGLADDFVAEYFEGTPCTTGGIDVEDVEEDLLARHESAFEDADLDRQGEYENRSDGLYHGWNPKTVRTLQQAVREDDYEAFGEFAAMVDGREDALRRLLEFRTDERESVPIEEVESVLDIVERFSTAAMSLGSLSPEAHVNNAVAMNRIGGKSNTGEGGEPVERFGTEEECSVKQVASGRFGVTAAYLSQAEELQIKMAQGSKPGEGGHLPGHKVNEMIAEVRHATPGVSLISPPPQHDIYSIEDLKQLIYDLRAASGDSDVNVKLVSEAGVGTIAAGVAKAGADTVHISGHSGGTGASPKTSIKNAGVPWELGLAETQQRLRETGLRGRVRIGVDGGFKTGRDVAVAAALGAEEFVFGTAALVTSGCVMARQCHENTCPVGVATQREDLRERFPGEPDHVINFVSFIAQQLREYMASLGLRSVDELVGRVDLLRQTEGDGRARSLDLAPILADRSGPRRRVEAQETDLDQHLDHSLVAAAEPALQSASSVTVSTAVSNRDRAVGAMLSNRVTEAYGVDGLPDDTVRVECRGTAGQSFGAFCAPGVTMHLTGSANDYVGKGLSGGRVVVQTPDDAAYEPTENVAVGNVALYGATGGECYVNGRGGERFAVRNSGTLAVVEGVGDHACEYMTGGAVAILGDTGRNFAAGMSGGVAYVYDPDDELADRTRSDMVDLGSDLDDRDVAMLRRLIENHAMYTDSDRARELLDEWEQTLDAFVKVLPAPYARALEEGASDVRSSPPARAAVATDGGGIVSDD